MNINSTQFSFGQVTSADGTIIGYRQIGSGPGLVIMHGGLRASQHYQRLASALADGYTVYIPDRRGRGLSGPVGDGYSVAKECEDLDAILKKTGARIIFGHSGGGLFALESALKLPIDKLILYEPAVSINKSLPLEWLPACEQAIIRGDLSLSMALIIKGLPLNWMSKLPRWILQLIFSLMLRSDEGDEIRELLPTIIHEGKAAQQLDSTHIRYKHITADTLLMGGAKSPAFLLDVLPILADIIPHARVVQLPGLDHTAPDEDAPESVADAVKQLMVTNKIMTTMDRSWQP
jgi:pimeloyl-ACP methyl ester carboxylesterase